MKNWNHNKWWHKGLAMILSLALTMSLLSGCRSSEEGNADIPQNIGIAVDTGDIDVTTVDASNDAIYGSSLVSDNVTQDIRLIDTELADASKDTDEEIDELSKAVSDGDLGRAKKTLSELTEALSEADDVTNEWLILQEQAENEIKAELSDEGSSLLADRSEALRNTLVQQQTETEAVLEELNQLLESEDIEGAVTKVEALKAVLQPGSITQNYGNGRNAEEIPLIHSADTATDLLTLSGETDINEDIMELAEELGTPLEVYNYLKNTLGYEYYYGSRKGANGTYAAFAGNDYDQASLMIGMLRYLGYEAEYVRGTILLEEEQALSLTGADTFEHAADILASAGVPVTKVTRNGEMIELQMEHVWVRALLPYTDYRGAGNADGENVWIDLDTGIKAYEDVDSIYDIAEEMNLPEGLSEAVESGDEEAIEAVLKDYKAEVEAMELDGVYARKRIIRQENLSYLPASLQYEVKKELATFSKISNTDKDSIRFEVAGEALGTYTASELAGRSILLAFLPASVADAEILNAYESIFDVPASYVYMKPALLIDGKVVSEAEDVEIPLGTTKQFRITLNRAGNVADKTKTVTNTVTAGSMYAVTIDNQMITRDELQSIYNKVTALADTVTEENVYSPEYLGKYLSLAGKLYFAQVDLYNIQSGEIYGMCNTRKLSEGITGYEVQRISRYGVVTSLSEGSLYIDIDADDHAVISLTGDSHMTKAYMMASGAMSSLYESIVWEQLTGYESVSTIAIFRKAKAEGIELLQITKDNLETELNKLNTDDSTRQAVRNAVNSGNMVTIPAEEVTIGDWTGTGYIIMDASGAGSYMISGGLNGGEIPMELALEVIAGAITAVMGTATLITTLIAYMNPWIAAIASLILILAVASLIAEMYDSYYDYIYSGDPESYMDTQDKAFQLFILGNFEQIISEFIFANYLARYLKKTGGATGESSSYSPKNKTSLWGQEKYVTEKGLNTVKQHLSGDLADEFNDAMINRLETAYKNNTKISGADLDFYAHEIYESNMMKNGMSYENAHEAAKAYYNATEFNFYHPEVIKQNPKLFNNAWFEFWGIERN